jgi:hypothetical protein
MHIENNVFKNIFNTVIDIKGKTKDNIKARMNIVLFCGRQNMELLNDGVCLEKPKTTFSLDKKKKTIISFL